MSRIKGRNTRPEVQLRKALHAAGLRFRLHDEKLPGKPDIVLKRWKAVIQVHGCFWHRHSGCKFATNPGTDSEKWQRKFDQNVTRDQRSLQALTELGWRVAVVWECGLERRADATQSAVVAWVRGGHGTAEFPANPA